MVLLGMTAAAVFFGVADSHHSQFCQAVSVFQRKTFLFINFSGQRASFSDSKFMNDVEYFLFILIQFKIHGNLLEID